MACPAGPAGDLAKTVKTAAEVPSEKAIKKMTARQLLACIDAKKPQELRLQAMQVLAVRAAVAPAKQVRNEGLEDVSLEALDVSWCVVLQLLNGRDAAGSTVLPQPGRASVTH